MNVVDARTFEARQSVRLSAPGVDTHISGLAFSPDSRSLWVGTESAIVEYGINTAIRRCFPAAAYQE